jgi:hypothetical protein
LTGQRKLTLRKAASALTAPKTPGAHSILATGGRYEAMASYARDHGLTMAEVQRLWHQHRGRA